MPQIILFGNEWMNSFSRSFVRLFVRSFIISFFLLSREVNSTEAYLKLETMLSHSTNSFSIKKCSIHVQNNTTSLNSDGMHLLCENKQYTRILVQYVIWRASHNAIGIWPWQYMSWVVTLWIQTPWRGISYTTCNLFDSVGLNYPFTALSPTRTIVI